MVLEALRQSSLATSVLYARQVSQLERSFIAHLSRAKDIQCTLVVDEVDDQNAEILVDQFSSMPSGVRLAGAEAMAEFQKIIDHRGVVAVSALYPLAHLGVARAAALVGDTAKSRKAYEGFFALWKWVTHFCFSSPAPCGRVTGGD